MVEFYWDRGISIFPVQLTMSRIGNLTYPVDPYSAICDDHTYIHTYLHTYIYVAFDQRFS